MSCVNIAELKRAHARFITGNRDAIREELLGAGRFAQECVQQRPHFKPKTGKLQSATKFAVACGARGGRLKIFNAMAYAAAIDKGARPHVIRARFRPMLVFYWAKIGRLMFLRRVNHPGNKPYSFLYDAWTRSAEHFLERMGPRMAALAKRF